MFDWCAREWPVIYKPATKFVSYANKCNVWWLHWYARRLTVHHCVRYQAAGLLTGLALLSQAAVSSPGISIASASASTSSGSAANATSTSNSFGLFSWVYGLGLGAYHYSLKMFVYQRVRARNFARAWSFVQAAQSLPMICGIPLAGKTLCPSDKQKIIKPSQVVARPGSRLFSVLWLFSLIFIPHLPVIRRALNWHISSVLVHTNGTLMAVLLKVSSARPTARRRLITWAAPSSSAAVSCSLPSTAANITCRIRIRTNTNTTGIGRQMPAGRGHQASLVNRTPAKASMASNCNWKKNVHLLVGWEKFRLSSLNST